MYNFIGLGKSLSLDDFEEVFEKGRKGNSSIRLTITRLSYKADYYLLILFWVGPELGPELLAC